MSKVGTNLALEIQQNSVRRRVQCSETNRPVCREHVDSEFLRSIRRRELSLYSRRSTDLCKSARKCSRWTSRVRMRFLPIMILISNPNGPIPVSRCLPALLPLVELSSIFVQIYLLTATTSPGKLFRKVEISTTNDNRPHRSLLKWLKRCHCWPVHWTYTWTSVRIWRWIRQQSLSPWKRRPWIRCPRKASNKWLVPRFVFPRAGLPRSIRTPVCHFRFVPDCISLWSVELSSRYSDLWHRPINLDWHPLRISPLRSRWRYSILSARRFPFEAMRVIRLNYWSHTMSISLSHRWFSKMSLPWTSSLINFVSICISSIWRQWTLFLFLCTGRCVL